MNTCQTIREALLNFDWTADDRRHAMEVLRHLETCGDCAAAAEDFDRARAELSSVLPNVPEDQWQKIESRFHAAVTRPRMRWGWVSAIAAAILVGVGGFEMGSWDRHAGEAISRSKQSNEIAAEFAPADAAQQIAVFNQVSSAFDHRAAWVMNADGQADMGVADKEIAPQHAVLLIRLTLELDQQAVSATDLVVVPGQTAKLTVPDKQGNRIVYEIGTSADMPTKLTLWAQLKTPHGDEILGAMATSLQMNPGQRVTAGEITTTTGHYQLKVAFSRGDLSGKQ